MAGRDRPARIPWPSRLRWRILAAASASLVALVVASVVLQEATVGLPKTRGRTPAFIAPPYFAPEIAETLRLPASVPAVSPTAPVVAVTNGDLYEINEPLDVVVARGSRLDVHSLDFDPLPFEAAPPGRPYTLPERRYRGTVPGAAGASFDATRWGDHALAVMRQVRRGISVRLYAKENFRLLVRGVAPAAPPRRRRTLALATWSGGRPDLFVIDWGRGRVPVTLRVYSGESLFRKRLLTQVLPVIVGETDETILEIARVEGRRPDLVLLKRRGPQAARPEVHVLSGESLFTEFETHLAVSAAAFSPREQVVSGTRLGQATEYVVDLSTRPGRVALLPIPFRANVPS